MAPNTHTPKQNKAPPEAYEAEMARFDASVTVLIGVEQPTQDLGQFKHDLTNVFAAIAGGVQLMMMSNIEDQKLHGILIHLETAVQSGLKTLESLHDAPEV